MNTPDQPEYRFLKPYRRPECYIGATWFGYYDVAGRNRDSDILTNFNFDCWVAFLTERLGEPDTVIGHEEETQSRSTFGDEESDEIYNWTICRENHWACGWIEIIRVHSSLPHEKLAAIDEQLHKLDGYPVFDEDHFSAAEDAERERCWVSDCKQLWYNWLEKRIGEERFNLLVSVYPEEIESVLWRGFEELARDGDGWAEPTEDYEVADLGKACEVSYQDDRTKRLFENLLAAELLGQAEDSE